MSRPPSWSPEDKLRIVLSVLANEVSVAEAARREGVSATSISKWRDLFLESGRQGLIQGGRAGPSAAEQRLEAENTELKVALGEAAAELRAWRKGGTWWQTFKPSS